MITVRSGAEERTFWGARLDVLIFRLRSYCVVISYTTDFNGPKIRKTLMFLGQAGTFLSFQARRSSATRSSTSDLTVHELSCLCVLSSSSLAAIEHRFFFCVGKYYNLLIPVIDYVKSHNWVSDYFLCIFFCKIIFSSSDILVPRPVFPCWERTLCAGLRWRLHSRCVLDLSVGRESKTNICITF